ncbi:MAG: pyroglutamyl-peptidase I [Clostridia bacterium]|nr:pyroglutamyl-peptidase I [Clostridia bacterium]
MKKLIITGFEPFGGELSNPSWDAISLLPDKIGNYQLIKVCLPVVFGRASDLLIKLTEKIRPDVVLSVGQAGGRDSITPEFVAFNVRHSANADNEGFCPVHESISESGDSAYFTTLPVKRIVHALRKSDIKSEVSYSAGTFVCNEVFYSMMRRFNGTGVRVGFIHIPYSTSQNKSPSMDLKTMSDGLKIAIENIN